MSGLLLYLILVVMLVAPFGVQRNHPPVAGDDHRVLVFNPAAIVEIPVAPGTRVASGTYVISNGYARSVASWTVSYWPEANT